MPEGRSNTYYDTLYMYSIMNINTYYVIVVTHARVPHGIYWLSSDLGPKASRAKTLLSQYIQCAHE